MATITTVTYRAGYKITQDYQGMEGTIEITGTVNENETPAEAFRAVRAEVRSWLKEDHTQSRKTVVQFAEQSRR